MAENSEASKETSGEGEKKPMISSEYRKEYANKPKDWLRDFVERQCYEEEKLPEDSKRKPKTVANVDLMAKLASINGIDVEKFKTGDYNNGQKVMNINNILRGHARKRHGLRDLEGKFHAVPAGDAFIEGHEATHDKDGNVIRKPATNAEGEAKKH